MPRHLSLAEPIRLYDSCGLSIPVTDEGKERSVIRFASILSDNTNANRTSVLLVLRVTIKSVAGNSKHCRAACRASSWRWAAAFAERDLTMGTWLGHDGFDCHSMTRVGHVRITHIQTYSDRGRGTSLRKERPGEPIRAATEREPPLI